MKHVFALTLPDDVITCDVHPEQTSTGPQQDAEAELLLLTFEKGSTFQRAEPPSANQITL